MLDDDVSKLLEFIAKKKPITLYIRVNFFNSIKWYLEYLTHLQIVNCISEITKIFI